VTRALVRSHVSASASSVPSKRTLGHVVTMYLQIMRGRQRSTGTATPSCKDNLTRIWFLPCCVNHTCVSVGILTSLAVCPRCFAERRRAILKLIEKKSNFEFKIVLHPCDTFYGQVDRYDQTPLPLKANGRRGSAPGHSLGYPPNRGCLRTKPLTFYHLGFNLCYCCKLDFIKAATYISQTITVSYVWTPMGGVHHGKRKLACRRHLGTIREHDSKARTGRILTK
jgi:hypothetical protein